MITKRASLQFPMHLPDLMIHNQVLILWLTGTGNPQGRMPQGWLGASAAWQD